ncbi:serine hydrolase domain-containing protein, partial [Singulisphaera rosea]
MTGWNGRAWIVLILGLASRGGTSTAEGDAIDGLIRAEMKAKMIPGLSLAIVERGVVVKSAGYGLANVELGVPAT